MKGQKTYHIIYCEELLDYPYNQLRWHDTQKQAENAGLAPCELCGADNWMDFEELDGSFFETNDRLLDAAFDAALEYGAEIGSEAGYEMFVNEYGAMEDMEGYSFGYNEGYYRGYDQGREDYASATFSDGFDEGYDRAKDEYEAKITKLDLNHAQQLAEAESHVPWTGFLLIAIVAFIAGTCVAYNKYGAKIQLLESQLSTQKFIVSSLENQSKKSSK